LKDRTSSQELLGRLDVTDVVDVIKRGRLLWFGHVDRKPREEWVKMCRDLVVVGAQGKGKGKKTWQECVNADIKQMRLKKCDARDCTIWRNGVSGKRLTSASWSLNRTLTDDDDGSCQEELGFFVTREPCGILTPTANNFL